MNKESLQNKLLSILEIARFAPSVHNTQPWKVVADGIKLVVSIDPDYRLIDGDPTGRETIISLGIFCESLVIAANNVGLQNTGMSPNGNGCVLTFKDSRLVPISKNDVSLLKRRCTDRSIYKPVTITSEVSNAISSARNHSRTEIKVVTDKKFISTVAQLTSQGIRLALSNPDFRKELSRYLVVPSSAKKRGISTKSLYISKIIEPIEPWLLRTGLVNGLESQLEKRRWQSASGIVLIFSTGDMLTDWFEVGRTYLRVSLAIENAGLSQATSAAIVEASTFHEDIEKLLGTNRRVQAILRIGTGKKKRHHSPRVLAKELIAT